VPGDRAAHCYGLMGCIAVEHDARRGWMLVHCCTRCGSVRRNKAAVGDPLQPDRFEELLRVAEERQGPQQRHEKKRSADGSFAHDV
jgi:hypothetical protein